MTKPSQAQIEAAANITDQDREYARDCLDDLKEEGDPVKTVAQWFRKVRHEYAITAAAEVGEPPDRNKWIEATQRRMDAAAALAIERCAQAAKEACEKWQIPSHRIIAAIRALKK